MGTVYSAQISQAASDMKWLFYYFGYILCVGDGALLSISSVISVFYYFNNYSYLCNYNFVSMAIKCEKGFYHGHIYKRICKLLELNNILP